MRINEITTSNEITLPGMVAMINRKCAPYIRQMGWNNLLFRGVHPATTPFTINQCPVNRKPKDTYIEIHNVADAWFQKNFGVKYRSNAVFASGSHTQAQSFGHVYAIFPCGNFKFCWSRDVEDMTKEFSWVRAYMYSDTDDGQGKFEDALAMARYSDQDLLGAQASGTAIMIHCNEHIMVDVEDGLLDDIQARQKSSIPPHN